MRRMAILRRYTGAHRHDTSAYGRVRIDRFWSKSRKIHRSAVAPAATADRGHQLCGLPTGVGTRRRGPGQRGCATAHARRVQICHADCSVMVPKFNAGGERAPGGDGTFDSDASETGRIASADRPRVLHPRRCGRPLLAAGWRSSSTVRSVRLAGPFSPPPKACFPHGRSALPADCGQSPHVDGFTRSAPRAGRTSTRARCELRTCTDSGRRSQAMRLARTVGGKMPPWTNGRRWRV